MKNALVLIWSNIGIGRLIILLTLVQGLAIPLKANAVPAFARQTGQNCVACHAGGQFPELTQIGRLFKLSGYTIGTRHIPLSVMGIASLAKSGGPAGGGAGAGGAAAGGRAGRGF